MRSPSMKTGPAGPLVPCPAAHERTLLLVGEPFGALGESKRVGMLNTEGAPATPLF